jgi:hypothetical protein
VAESAGLSEMNGTRAHTRVRMASSDDSPLVAARPTRLAGKTLATTCTIVNDDQLLYRAGNGNIRLTLALSEAIKQLHLL